MRGPPVWAAGTKPGWAGTAVADGAGWAAAEAESARAAGDARAGTDEAEETGAVEAGCGAVVARDCNGVTVTVSLKPIWAKMVLSGW